LSYFSVVRSSKIIPRWQKAHHPFIWNKIWLLCMSTVKKGYQNRPLPTNTSFVTVIWNNLFLKHFLFVFQTLTSVTAQRQTTATPSHRIVRTRRAAMNAPVRPGTAKSVRRVKVWTLSTNRVIVCVGLAFKCAVKENFEWIY
jgi:hypothetical protein